MRTNTLGKQVCVVIGATSKWQSDGRNTLLAHGHAVDDSDVEVGVRWGVGGAIAQKFAQEGFFTVLTTRNEANAASLASAIREQGGECMILELDLVSQDSIASAFAIYFVLWWIVLFVTLPFVVRSVQPVLIELDRETEEASNSLGAGPFTTR